MYINTDTDMLKYESYWSMPLIPLFFAALTSATPEENKIFQDTSWIVHDLILFKHEVCNIRQYRWIYHYNIYFKDMLLYITPSWYTYRLIHDWDEADAC